MKHGRVRKTLLYSSYHILVWAAAVDKELVCERETDNSYDLYAVAVKRMGNINRSFAAKAVEIMLAVLETMWRHGLSSIERKKKIIQNRHDSRNRHFLALWRTWHTRTNVSVIFGP